MNEIIKAGKEEVVKTKYGFDFDLGHSISCDIQYRST